jgi:membrane protein
MGHVAENLRQSFLRVFPDCVALGQAVAFNMFLAFFPLILFALGILSSMTIFQDVVRDLPAQIQSMLPEGSSAIVLDYFVRRTAHPWQWIWLGFGGTLIAGTQVFIGLIQGFRQIDKLPAAPSYLRVQLRAAIILCLTIIPFLAFEIVTIFGRPVRHWMLANYGLGPWIRIAAAAAYHGLAMVFALGVVFVIYRLGQPDMTDWHDVFPGAAVATILWWIVDISFGFYVRYVPYGTVYRGLAAVIGLLLWMYLTAMVIFIGAAYNAVTREGPFTNTTDLKFT